MATGWDCVVARGWAAITDCVPVNQISFSGEPGGWQVSIEGPMQADVAARLTAAVTDQIQQEVSKPIEWLQIG